MYATDMPTLNTSNIQYIRVCMHSSCESCKQSCTGHKAGLRIWHKVSTKNTFPNIRKYSGACIIRHPLGLKNSAGLAGCWIMEVSLYGKN